MTEQLFYVATAPFEAARKVDILPSNHRTFNFHGHSFTAKIRTEVSQGFASFPRAEVEQLQGELA